MRAADTRYLLICSRRDAGQPTEKGVLLATEEGERVPEGCAASTDRE